MVKIEISSSIYILAESTNDNLWSVLGSMICSTIENEGKTNIIDEKIKKNSFEDFLETCLEEFSHSFRGSVLIIEDTLTGKPSCMLGDINKKGIISKTAESLFKKIKEKNEESFYLSASYLEMCSESLLDLFDSSNHKIKYPGDGDFQLVMQNVKKQEIYSSDIVLDLITLGTRRRTFENTSHTLFNISLTQQKTTSVKRVLEPNLNFLFLSGCVSQEGAFGDHIKKGCNHFPINDIIDLLEDTNRNNVKADDSLLKVVLKHFLGGIRVVCTLSPDSGDSFNFFSFSDALSDAENELVGIQKVPLSGLPSSIDNTCQDEPDTITDKEVSKTTGMFQKPTSNYAICRNNSFLETIEEEEEEMEDASICSDMTSVSTKKEKQGEEELKMQNGDNSSYLVDDASPQNALNSVCDGYRLEVCPDAFDSQDCLLYYQRKYDELQEFTSNEKTIYEESFNIQISEANSRIEELEEMNKKLVKKLNEAKCESNSLTKSLENERVATKRELTSLKRELENTVRKRSECEMKLELLEKNYRNRSRELVESLEEAYKELSSYRDPEENTNSIEDISSEDETKNEFSNEITSLKNEICFLKNENAKYANLSQKIEEYMRIKKCLVQEASLSAKIADLELEICSLKKTNKKLSEDLIKKDIELKELGATYSLYMEENILSKGETEMISKRLEQVLEEKEKQNCEISDLKALISVDSDKIKTLSKNVEEKVTEIDFLKSENSRLKEDLKQLNKISSKLSGSVKEKERNIEDLIFKNSKLKDEISKLESKNNELSNVLVENENEIDRLVTQNSVQQENISSMIVKMREEMDRLSLKLNTSETKITNLSHLDEENVKLRDEISELQYKVKSLLDNSQDKFVKIQELVSENTLLKDQIFSYMKEIEHLTGYLRDEKYKIKVYDHENEKLKKEICLLRQKTFKISESLDEKDVKIQDLTNSNFILKEEISSLRNSNKKVESETAIKMKALDCENSSLKENIHILTSNLEEKNAELKKLITKQEEEKCAMDKLVTEVAILKKEISLLHKENGSLSKMMNQNNSRKHKSALHKDTSKTFPNYENLEKETPILSDPCNEHLNVDRTKLFSPCLASTTNEEVKDCSHFTYSNLCSDTSLEEEQKVNRLRRKVVQQKKLLNMAQKREMQMQTNMEMCKSQMDSIQNLRESYALQNHRIMCLELQAQHDENMHRSQETFINGLRGENALLKARLHQMNCKLKNLFLGIKNIRNNSHSNFKQEIAVQTIPSSTDSSLNDINFLKPDNNVIKENNAETRVKDFGTQCESSNLPSIERQIGIQKMEKPLYNVLKIKSKKSLEITMKKNVYSTAASEKKVSKICTKTPYHRYVPSLCTGYYYKEDCNVLGAEGWARLSREFDLQQNK